MGRIGKPQTLTVNCQGESNGVLTFGWTRTDFCGLHELQQPNMTCLTKISPLKTTNAQGNSLCQTLPLKTDLMICKATTIFKPLHHTIGL